MSLPILRGLLFVFFWLVAGWLPATATHLVGGELSYRYLNANGPPAAPFRYEITARIYQKPSENLGATGRIRIYSKDPTTGFQLLDDQTIAYNSASSVSLPPIADCVVQLPEIALRLYTITVNLPAVPEGYQAVYEASARTTGITNVANSVNQPMALAIDMTPPTLPNSSPTFSSDAIDLICLGDTTAVLNNASDADGDRLSYSFAVPDAGLGAPIGYATGYSVAQPFGSNGFIALNPTTGLARYVSQRQGLFLVAIDVSEYRTVNGREILLGKVRRDIQITARACSLTANQAPQFSAATLAYHNFVVGEGQSLAFTVAATDPDTQQVLTLTVASALLDGAGAIDATFNSSPGIFNLDRQVGIVSVSGLGTASGVFRLVAGCGLARATPYDVLLTASDNVCNRKTVVGVLRITVTSNALPPTSIRGDSLLCNQTETTYSVVSPTLSRYQWSVTGGELIGVATGPNVRVRWQESGQKSVSARGVAASGCLTASATQIVTVVSGPVVVGPRTFCRTANTGLAYSVAGPVGVYRWTITNGVIISGQGTNAVVADINPGATATLQVENSSAVRCRVSTLSISPDNSCLYFYNVITPNGDGRNDVFEIENLARHPGTALTVFNRWGGRTYDSADYHNDFGAEAAPGVYYYLCRLADGTTYKGWVEVVR